MRIILYGFWIVLAPLAIRAEEARKILIFHSFGRNFAPFNDVAESFHAEFAKLYKNPYGIMEASLEMARFDGEGKEVPLLEYLTALHRDEPPDLVVAIGAQAAKFCLRHREQAFPGSPVLMLGIDERRFGGLAGSANSAMIGERLEPDGYIRNILSLLPETRHIYLVMGTSPLEEFWERAFLEEWKEFEGRVAFHSLSGQPVARMRETVKTLPPRSVVLVGVVNLDAAGVPHERESALIALHEDSNSPVFGMLPTQLGLGIVGGPLSPGTRTGVAGAEAAVDILKGTPASSLPVRVLGENPPAYDWRELKRWGIPAKRLPPGSMILYREPGLWETHRTAALVAVAFIAVQWALIASLLSIRKREREANASLNLAADAANIGLWRRDPVSGDFVASKRWRTIFGLPANGKLAREEVLTRMPAEDRELMTAAMEHSARENQPFALEHRVLHPDGTVRWVATHGRAEPGRNGTDYGTRGASLDITERREATATTARLRNELAHLSRVSSLGVLSGALAHEINQPLGIILSNAQAAEFLLETENPDLDSLRAILADIVREDRRAGDVIKRLRSLLRRGETAAQPVDLNDCIREVLKLTHSDLIGRGVAAVTRLSPGTLPVLADRVQLQQVVLNLITNACDAMARNAPADRQVELATFRKGGSAHMTVRDLGSGLPGNPERLFEPFHTTKEHGLGMGLAICRTLITAHNGKLWAEPNNGRGATFHILMPITPLPP